MPSIDYCDVGHILHNCMMTGNCKSRRVKFVLKCNTCNTHISLFSKLLLYLEIDVYWPNGTLMPYMYLLGIEGEVRFFKS